MQRSNESINPFNSPELRYLRLISFCASLYTGLSDGEARKHAGCVLGGLTSRKKVTWSPVTSEHVQVWLHYIIQSTIGFSVKQLQLDSFSFRWFYDQYMLILSFGKRIYDEAWGTQSHNLFFDPLASGLPRHNTHRLARNWFQWHNCRNLLSFLFVQFRSVQPMYVIHLELYRCMMCVWMMYIISWFDYGVVSTSQWSRFPQTYE